MNTSRMAVALAALGLAFAGPPAWANGAGAATSEPATQAQADLQNPVASDGAANAAQQGKSDEATRRNASKHPPTARMDRATPSEKASPSDADSSMHPPTGRMDRATPAEKSPGSDSAVTPKSSPDADKAPAQSSPEPDTARPKGSSTP